MVLSGYSETYYSVGSGAVNILANWNTQPDGLGTAPSGFGIAGNVFKISGGHSMTTTAAWALTGAGTRLEILSGGTLTATYIVAVPNFKIESGGTYIHDAASSNVNGLTNDIPGSTSRDFGAGSTVEIKKWANGGTSLSSSGSSLPLVSWGNLIINIASLNASWRTNNATFITQGDLVIKQTGGGSNAFKLSGASTTGTIGGKLKLEGGRLSMSENNSNVFANNFSLTIAGDFEQTGGTFTLSEVTASATTYKLRVKGNAIFSSGEFIGSGSTTNSCNVNLDFEQDLQVKSGFVFRLSKALTAITAISVIIGGDLLVETGGIISNPPAWAANPSGGAVIYFKGGLASSTLTLPAGTTTTNIGWVIGRGKTLNLGSNVGASQFFSVAGTLVSGAYTIASPVKNLAIVNASFNGALAINNPAQISNTNLKGSGLSTGMEISSIAPGLLAPGTVITRVSADSLSFGICPAAINGTTAYTLNPNPENFTAGEAYYSVASGMANVSSNWNSKPDGSGVTPANFTTAGRIFKIQHSHTMTTSAGWAISGTGSQLEILSGGTLNAGHIVAVPVFKIQDGGLYIHNAASAVANGTSNDIPGSQDRKFGPGSTVEIKKWANGGTSLSSNSSSLPGVKWGNLVIDIDTLNASWRSNAIDKNWFTVQGDLIIKKTGGGTNAFKLSGAEQAAQIGGNLKLEGGRLSLSENNSNVFANTFSLTVTGDFEQTGGIFTMSEVASAATTYNLWVKGNTLLSAGTFTGSGNATVSCNINIKSDGNFTIKPGAVFTLAKGSTIKAISLIIGGNFSVEPGGTFTTPPSWGANPGGGAVVYFKGGPPSSTLTISGGGTINNLGWVVGRGKILMLGSNVATDKFIAVAGSLEKNGYSTSTIDTIANSAISFNAQILANNPAQISGLSASASSLQLKKGMEISSRMSGLLEPGTVITQISADGLKISISPAAINGTSPYSTATAPPNFSIRGASKVKIPFGVALNQDGDASFLSRDPVESERLLRSNIDFLADAGIKTAVYSVGSGADALYYPTLVSSKFGWRTTIYDTDTAWIDRLACVRNALAAGLDAVKIAGSQAKSKGMYFIPSLRMNDSHFMRDPQNFPLTGKFWLDQDSAGTGLTIQDSPLTWETDYRHLFDYTHEAVRNYRYNVVKEVVLRNDTLINGFELDFNRVQVFFPRGKAEERAYLMTDLVRKVRALLDSVASVQSRPMSLFVRVPPSDESCKWAGLDVNTWIEEGLVDVVAPSQLMTLAYDMPIENMVSLAHRYGVQVYPSLYPRTNNRVPFISSDTTNFGMDKGYDISVLQSETMAAAANYRLMGVDGFYLYNYPVRTTPPSTYPLVAALAYNKQDGSDKHFGITSTYYNDDKVPSYAYVKQLPKTISGSGTFSILVGELPQQAPGVLKQAVLRLGIRNYTGVTAPEVSLNGSPLVFKQWKDHSDLAPLPADMAQRSYIYEVDTAVLLKGANQVQVAVSSATVNDLGISYAFAGTYYSVKNGDVNDTSSWNSMADGTGHAPSGSTDGDEYIIQAGHTMTVDKPWTLSLAAALKISDGGTLNAASLITAGDFEIENGGLYIHNAVSNTLNGSAKDIPGSKNRMFAAGSTVELRKWANGGVSMTSVNTSLPAVSWGNLIINIDTLNASWRQTGVPFKSKGNLTIKKTGGGTNIFKLSGANATDSIGGNFKIEGGMFALSDNSSNVFGNNFSLTVAGNMEQSGGAFTLADQAVNSTTYHLTVKGNTTISGGYFCGSGFTTGAFTPANQISNVQNIQGPAPQAGWGIAGSGINNVLGPASGITLTSISDTLYTISANAALSALNNPGLFAGALVPGCSTTAGSNVVTVGTANTTKFTVGKRVGGRQIFPGTTVKLIDHGAGTLTLSDVVRGAETGISLIPETSSFRGNTSASMNANVNLNFNGNLKIESGGKFGLVNASGGMRAAAIVLGGDLSITTGGVLLDPPSWSAGYGGATVYFKGGMASATVTVPAGTATHNLAWIVGPGKTLTLGSNMSTDKYFAIAGTLIKGSYTLTGQTDTLVNPSLAFNGTVAINNPSRITGLSAKTSLLGLMPGMEISSAAPNVLGPNTVVTQISADSLQIGISPAAINGTSVYDLSPEPPNFNSGLSLLSTSALVLDARQAPATIAETPNQPVLKPKMKGYPNPATDHITISHAVAHQGAKLSVVGMTGRVMATYMVPKNADSTYLKTDNFMPGVYIVVYENNGTVERLKFLK